MECTIETKAETILQFIQGLRGNLHVTFEEGACAAWLYDLLRPHVTKVVVCNPRKNALLKAGDKSDRIDARKQSFVVERASQELHPCGIVRSRYCYNLASVVVDRAFEWTTEGALYAPIETSCRAK